MIGRLQNMPKNRHFFLFGARGTGKTTLLRHEFGTSGALWIDFLSDEDEERFSHHPDLLSRILEREEYPYVIIDEVQKVPKILDIVHREIERKHSTKFIMTGSSARKLKRGGADMLAGRAFTFFLHPLTYRELGERFDLKDVLEFGSLPGLTQYTSREDKQNFLRAYTRTYLKEEIRVEQIVRHIDPFRDFLEIAAQCNGEIINYAKIAREVGVDDKTVRNYFSILEDTLLGIFLPSYHHSVRKQQRESPKFYLFDPGIKRVLDRTTTVELLEQTYAFGKAFEHWVILEVFRLNDYFQKDYKFYYLRTKNGVEIDLIIDRPGREDLIVEIKSTRRVGIDDITRLRRFAADWDRPVIPYVWSRDPVKQEIEGVRCLPWEAGMEEAGLLPGT